MPPWFLLVEYEVEAFSLASEGVNRSLLFLRPLNVGS